VVREADGAALELSYAETAIIPGACGSYRLEPLRRCGSEGGEELRDSMILRHGTLTPTHEFIALDVGGTSFKSALVAAGRARY
jgi:hypothetical protein